MAICNSTRADGRELPSIMNMDDQQRRLRLLVIQTTHSVSSEVKVLHTLLSHLQPLSHESGIAVEVLLIQGVDGSMHHEGGRRSASLFRQVPNITVHDLNMGKLGQPDSPRLGRALKVLDLARVRMARRGLLGIARAFRPHLIYSSQQVWDLRIATPLARALGRPQVVHVHYNVCVLGAEVIDVLRQARMVIAVSDFIRDDAIAHGVDPGRVHTLYNSIAVPTTPTPQERLASRQHLRTELGVPEDAFLVGMVGRLSPSKGQPELLEALLPIMERDLSVHLVLAGSEYPAHNGMSAAIEHTAREHNCHTRVHLLGHRSDVPNILDAIDLFAHPTRLDPCPLAVLEATAHGLPIVAWREGGTAALVQDQKTGLLAEPLDIAGLSHALHRLITDRVSRETMGRLARQRAANMFHPAIAASSYLTILQEGVGVLSSPLRPHGDRVSPART